MNTRIMLAGVVAIIGIFAGACTAALGTPKQTTIDISYDEFAQVKNISKEITIAKDAQLVIELPSNPSTGFGWTEAEIAEASILQENENKFVEPEEQAMGTEGTQVWTFTATEKGTTTVEMEYSRPWEGGEKAEWTLEITVVVQ
jgi:inhibitor of cysteine peptidase